MIIIIVVIIRHAFCGKLNAFFPTSWRWQLNHPFMKILEMVFQFIIGFNDSCYPQYIPIIIPFRADKVWHDLLLISNHY